MFVSKLSSELYIQVRIALGAPVQFQLEDAPLLLSPRHLGQVGREGQIKEFYAGEHVTELLRSRLFLPGGGIAFFSCRFANEKTDDT